MATPTPDFFGFDKLFSPFGAKLATEGQAGVRRYDEANPRGVGTGKLAADMFGAVGKPLGSFGQVLSPLAFGNLGNILASQGKTDPALLNQQLASISQGTQGNQDALQGQLARLGLQNSGVGQAIGGAIGQSGVQQRSSAIAQENALAEERKRSDIGLFNQTITDQIMKAFGITKGVPVDNSPSGTDQALQFVSTILPALLAN